MDEFQEDEPGAARDRANRLMVARLKREAIVDLLRVRRPNGDLLSDVDIAVRVGCLPSDVRRVRSDEDCEDDTDGLAPV